MRGCSVLNRGREVRPSVGLSVVELSRPCFILKPLKDKDTQSLSFATDGAVSECGVVLYPWGGTTPHLCMK